MSKTIRLAPHNKSYAKHTFSTDFRRTLTKQGWCESCEQVHETIFIVNWGGQRGRRGVSFCRNCVKTLESVLKSIRSGSKLEWKT